MIGLARLLWKPAVMLALFGAVALALREGGFDPKAAMASAGSHGPAVFVVVGAVACAVAVPRQVVALAGGYAFGFWPGVVLSLIAEVAGCTIDFFWVRWLGRGAALSFLRRREGGKLDRMDRFLTGRAFTATLTLRLLPVGSNVLLNLAAGVSGVAATPFLVASAIGYVPQTVVFALAGAGAGLSNGVQFGLAAALLLVSVALGVLLLRRRPAVTAL